MAKKGGAPQNLDPVRTKDEAKRRGRNGGIKSGEVRRNKRDAKNAARLFLNLAATGNAADNLKSLGVAESDQTNMVGLMARLWLDGMKGDQKAIEMLLKTAGYDAEENRKERESIAKDKRLERESIAKVNQLEMSHEGSFGVSSHGGMSLDEDDEKDDVVIFMPYNGRQGTPPPKDSSVLSKNENNDVTDGGQDNGEDNT